MWAGHIQGCWAVHRSASRLRSVSVTIVSSGQIVANWSRPVIESTAWKPSTAAASWVGSGGSVMVMRIKQAVT